MSSAGQVVVLDPTKPEQVLAAATLHATLLGRSPIPRLGSYFMTRFFYSTLVEDGLIRCYLYRLGDRYVGFLSLTDRPHTFMNEGRRRHLVRLAWVLGLAILVRPRRIRILMQTLAAARRKTRTTANAEGVGELLSFGVLADVSATRDPARGLRIPNVLFDEGLRDLRERGFRRIEWTVDRDNLPAMIFYRSYGAVVEQGADPWPGDYRMRLDLPTSP